MTKYFDSPLKITGLLLSGTGFIISFFSMHPSLPDGKSLIMLGGISLLTAWMITRSPLKQHERSIFEICLVVILIVFSALMAMDYYGIIAFQHLLSTL
jgi:hypothetical protein